MCYDEATIKKFTENFTSKDFDYLKFEPDNNLIIVDINSSKTQVKLKKIVLDYIGEIKLYISSKFGIGEL